jgi:outer membrane protein OmpA-like peptidoglycan-associated protein
VPDVATRHAADGSVVTTLPASRLGFTEGSWQLSADADHLLSDIVGTARDGRHAVEVTGYVAFWGSEAYRADLSTKRATAVADRLVASGVPASQVTAVGGGAADGPEASQTDGQFDEAKVRAAGLRRVVVTVRPLNPL